MTTMHKRILIAEDNRCLRRVIQSALEDRYAVTCVGDARSMEEQLLNHHFDLVITDLNLPDRSGTAVLREVERRCTGNLEQISHPTLVITGMDPDDEVVASVRRMVHVREVFMKPLDIELLVRRVDQLMVVTPKRANLTETRRTVVLPRILVVDDDPGVRDLLSLTFEEVGIQAVCCGSAKAAEEACRRQSYDLMLLDFYLDGDTAEDVLQQMQKTLGEDMPPTLLISGYASGLTMDRFRRYPQVKAIFSKPLLTQLVLNLAQRIMAKGVEKTVAEAHELLEVSTAGH